MLPVNSVPTLTTLQPPHQLKLKLQCTLMQELSRVDLLIEQSSSYSEGGEEGVVSSQTGETDYLQNPHRNCPSPACTALHFIQGSGSKWESSRVWWQSGFVAQWVSWKVDDETGSAWAALHSYIIIIIMHSLKTIQMRKEGRTKKAILGVDSSHCQGMQE